MRYQTINRIRQAWVAAAIILLSVVLFSFGGTANDDAEILLIYGMAALSFPSSLLFLIPAGYILNYWFNDSGWILTTSYVSLVIEWACFFALGYLQWFKALPWIVKRMFPSKWVRDNGPE